MLWVFTCFQGVGVDGWKVQEQWPCAGMQAVYTVGRGRTRELVVGTLRTRSLKIPVSNLEGAKTAYPSEQYSLVSPRVIRLHHNPGNAIYQ